MLNGAVGDGVGRTQLYISFSILRTRYLRRLAAINQAGTTAYHARFFLCVGLKPSGILCSSTRISNGSVTVHKSQLLINPGNLQSENPQIRRQLSYYRDLVTVPPQSLIKNSLLRLCEC